MIKHIFSFLIAMLVYWLVYFVCSEVMLMGEVVGAIIAAGVAVLVGLLGLIGVCVANGRKTKTLNNNLLKLQDCQLGVSDGQLSLSNQIGVNGGADNSLYNQHKAIENKLSYEVVKAINDTNDNVNKTFTKTGAMYNLLKTERELRKQRELLLSANEYRLSQAIEDISSFKALWLEKSEQIQELTKQVETLERENHRLSAIIAKQNEENKKEKEAIADEQLTYEDYEL